MNVIPRAPGLRGSSDSMDTVMPLHGTARLDSLLATGTSFDFVFHEIVPVQCRRGS